MPPAQSQGSVYYYSAHHRPSGLLWNAITHSCACSLCPDSIASRISFCHLTIATKASYCWVTLHATRQHEQSVYQHAVSSGDPPRRLLVSNLPPVQSIWLLHTDSRNHTLNIAHCCVAGQAQASAGPRHRFGSWFKQEKACLV